MTSFGFESTTDDVLDGADLTDVNVVITGTSAGLGVEAARALAAHGATVVGVVRDLTRRGGASTTQAPAASTSTRPTWRPWRRSGASPTGSTPTATTASTC